MVLPFQNAVCQLMTDSEELNADTSETCVAWRWISSAVEAAECGAVELFRGVQMCLDNTTTPTAVSVSQWLCTVHQGALQQKSYRVSVRLNYLLYGDSYLTEYFRFDGICSLNTETRVGFPDNGNYVILWITVDYESSYPQRITRVPSADHDGQ